PALTAVEELVVADLRRCRFVLDARRALARFDVRKRVRAAAIAYQQRIALRVVPRAFRRRHDPHEAAIRVLPVARRDALRDDRAPRVAADVDHLRPGIGLLVVVRHGHGVELADGVRAAQDAARVFPRDRGARLDLRPRDLRVGAAAFAALRHEVVDAAPAFLVAGIPVLHGRVLDLGALERDELDDRRVELVLVAHRRRAALEIAYVAAFVGYDQRAFELARIRRV